MKRLVVPVVLSTALFLSAGLLMGQAAKKKAFVYVPFSKLTLSDDQAEKIGAIQAEIRGKIKALEAEEYERCSQVLSADQRSQLTQMEEDDKAKARERSKAAYQKRKAAEAEKKKPTQ